MRSNKKHTLWFEQVRPRYATLANTVAATIRTLLQNDHIDVIDVTHRAKTSASFAEKLKRKRYLDPQREMTDLAGVRVVTLIERDIERVVNLVKTSFNVHPQYSVDKSADLGSDKFGYRSVHFVCDIGERRTSLPEFSPYANMLFEVQIRTALQHAWAEIEHDRSYKFSGELPSPLKRRFHLIAGLLELADREFSSLTDELEAYQTTVQTQTDAGNLEIELNSTSASEFLKLTIGRHGGRPGLETTLLDHKDIAELRRFGIDTVAKFSLLLNDEFLAEAADINTTAIGLVRDAMIFADIGRYFEIAWSEGWHGWDQPSLHLAEKRYGHERLQEIIERHGIDVFSEHWSDGDSYDDSL